MIIGIGIDVVEIIRIKQPLESESKRFLTRIFTESEINYSRKGKDSIQKYAARFAAKEATMKALGTGWAKGISWRDIEVVSKPEEPPRITLGGKALEIFEEMGAKKIHLSLSHQKMFASALVIIES